MPRGKKPKNEGQGVPIANILQAARTEPLNHPLTIKLWPSVAAYITEGPGAGFVREAILEKLQRIADKPTPAVCGECTHLTRQDGEPFCLILVAFLQKKHLKEKWNCEYFKAKKGGSQRC